MWGGFRLGGFDLFSEILCDLFLFLLLPPISFSLWLYPNKDSFVILHRFGDPCLPDQLIRMYQILTYRNILINSL